MPNYLSDHYTATVGGATIDDPRLKVPAGIDHAAVRYKRATVTAAAGVTDDEQMRFFPMKSSDRIFNLFLQTPSLTGTNMTSDCGIYQTDLGALIDLSLFGSAADVPLDDLQDAIPRTDLFSVGLLEDEDRGKRLWELALEGAGTDTEDPNETWDIVITINTETAITVGAEFVMEVLYTAGAGS